MSIHTPDSRELISCRIPHLLLCESLYRALLKGFVCFQSHIYSSFTLISWHGALLRAGGQLYDQRWLLCQSNLGCLDPLSCFLQLYLCCSISAPDGFGCFEMFYQDLLVFVYAGSDISRQIKLWLQFFLSRDHTTWKYHWLRFFLYSKQTFVLKFLRLKFVDFLQYLTLIIFDWSL